jgi:hypothetical protein
MFGPPKARELERPVLVLLQGPVPGGTARRPAVCTPPGRRRPATRARAPSAQCSDSVSETRSGGRGTAARGERRERLRRIRGVRIHGRVGGVPVGPRRQGEGGRGGGEGDGPGGDGPGCPHARAPLEVRQRPQQEPSGARTPSGCPLYWLKSLASSREQPQHLRAHGASLRPRPPAPLGVRWAAPPPPHTIASPRRPVARSLALLPGWQPDRWRIAARARPSWSARSARRAAARPDVHTTRRR